MHDVASEPVGSKTTVVYDDGIVRQFMLVSIFWGIVAMLIGVLIATQLAFWPANFNTRWITFGRIRPLHTNAGIFAFVGNMMFAGIYYSTQRLVKARLPSRFLSLLHFWGWQLIIVAAAITLPLGLTRGKEYAELIWPINIAVAVIWLVFAANFFWLLARRNERSLYVAIWFYIASIVTVTVLYVVNHLSIPTSLTHSYPIFGGVQDALVQWWYGHNAVAFFLTTPILGIMYYFLPKAAERPVYSYRLSIVHFWSLVFVYIWAGPHHLLNTALPSWLQSLGMVFSLMLWAPSWGGMLNGLLTLRGAWDKLRTDPVLKFFAAGVTFYGMATFEGPLLAIKSVNALAHYSDWIIGHVHSGALGWNGFMAAGMFYFLAPRLWNRKLYSVPLANMHFWLGLVGILLYIASMWVSGVTQGLMLSATKEGGTVLAYPNFIDAVLATRAMMWTRAAGGALYLSGFFMLAYNVVMTARGAEPVNGTVEVFVQEHEDREMSFLAGFFNVPVVFTFLTIIFATGWAALGGFPGGLCLVGLVAVVLFALILAQSQGIGYAQWYERLLENALPFTSLTIATVLVGGAVQIIPTVMIDKAESIEGVRQIPYTPLELAGRDIYIREGCYLCHSQMIRTLTGDVLRYGDYSKLGESIYDHPFQWGSKRIGPDLARIGGKYPDVWHFEHMQNPRNVTPGSIMPNYPWLYTDKTDVDALPNKIAVQRIIGVPYPASLTSDAISRSVDAQERSIVSDLKNQGALIQPDREIVALIAYLQKVGKSEKVATPAQLSRQPATAQENSTGH
ncbi:MAG TPA: cytochrome-c oxidase, cbb3-type subunit I [Chthoniobacteraceae bacterium]|jgi:cytochrome c oxidase cbb3-type subunit I/II|nr:cytochrome-c oxidase, cbb3-type subunit I [Chthoniobacteraceae bacterium]